MKPWQWLALVLIGAGGLVLLGWEIGQVQATRRLSAALVAAEAADRATVASRDSLFRVAAAWQRTAGASAARADTLAAHARIANAEQRLAASRAEAAQAALESARTASDSLPRVVALVGVLQQAVAVAGVRIALSDSTAAAWQDAFQRQLAASAALTAIHRTDSLTIARKDSLVHQAIIPAPPGRWLGFLPALHVKPCAAAVLTTHGEGRIGVGVCLVL